MINVNHLNVHLVLVCLLVCTFRNWLLLLPFVLDLNSTNFKTAFSC